MNTFPHQDVDDGREGGREGGGEGGREEGSKRVITYGLILFAMQCEQLMMKRYVESPGNPLYSPQKPLTHGVVLERWIAQLQVCCIHYTLHTIHYTLYTIHYTLHPYSFANSIPLTLYTLYTLYRSSI